MLTPTAAEIGSGVSVRKRRRQVGVADAVGVRRAGRAAAAFGQRVTISKEIYNLDGTPANLATMKQNDRVVVVLRGGMRDHARRDMAIVDMLPAGWEIEGPVRMTESGGTVYPWLPEVSYPQVQEARDDRFVVGFGVGSSYRMSAEEEARTPLPAFTFAYVARGDDGGGLRGAGRVHRGHVRAHDHGPHGDVLDDDRRAVTCDAGRGRPWRPRPRRGPSAPGAAAGRRPRSGFCCSAARRSPPIGSFA